MWNVAGKYDIKDALDEIASRITMHDSLMIVIITHGGSGGFGIRVDVTGNEAVNNPSSQSGWMSYSDLGNYINTNFGDNDNRKYAVMIIVNQACFSGTMRNYLYGTNRILISAADSGHKAYTEYAYRIDVPFQHFAFLYQGKGWWWQTHDGFILALGNIINSRSIKNAYDNGVEAVNINIQDTPSNPQIDDNLNGFSAEDGVYDGDEYDHGTNPQDEDMDDDGLTDRQEVKYYNTDGCKWDTDGDGISDLNEYSWLFTLYVDDDNIGNMDLHLWDILTDIKDGLNAAGTGDTAKEVGKFIHVLVEYDGNGEGDSARYEIKVVSHPMYLWEWSIEKLEDLGEVDMSSSNTLSSFIRWSMTKYSDIPNKVLIMADHGGGWKGIFWDHHSGDSHMSLSELKNALSSGGEHFDIMGFDACLMQMEEVIYEIRDYANDIIGSEDTEMSYSWDYNNVFRELAMNFVLKNRPIHTQDISNEIITWFSGASVSDVSPFLLYSDLTPNINNFAQELINQINSGYGEEIKQIISDTQHMHASVRGGDFFNHSYRDLYDFAERIRNHFGASSSVGRAAQDVMDAIEAAVIREKHNATIGNYHGISIFLPDEAWWGDYYDSYWSKYTSLDFSSASNWDEFLYTLYEG